MTIICYKNWEKLCDLTWESGRRLPEKPCILFCTTDHIDNLFRDILDSNYSIPLVLVSGASDNGIVESIHSNSVRDISRFFPMVPDLAQFSGNGNRDFVMRARKNIGKCLDRDKYTVRMYSWVSSTFPMIPSNIIKWFCTNCNIVDDRIVQIPFGVNEFTLNFYHGEKSQKILLAAWGYNTNERAQLMKYLEQTGLASTYQDLEHSKYLDEIRNHRANLCPVGNGYDSYRILETLYCGRVPIILYGNEPIYWLEAYRYCPYIAITRFDYEAILNNLEKQESLFSENDWQTAISMEYWECLIKAELKAIF